VDDVSTGQIFDVNNVGKANGEYEQQKSLTLTRMTTTNTADAIVAVIPPLFLFSKSTMSAKRKQIKDILSSSTMPAKRIKNMSNRGA
jgi:hypothetical protein